MTRPKNCIDPDQVVIPKAMTARDLLVHACRNDPKALAQAAMVKPGQQHTLTTNIGVTFDGEDVQAILAAAGFQVQHHAANDQGDSA